MEESIDDGAVGPLRPVARGATEQLHPLSRKNTTIAPQTKVQGATGNKVIMKLKSHLIDSPISQSIFCATNSSPYQVNKKRTEL